MLKQTALYEAHKRAGAKLIEFGGWEMPVQYSSIVSEHLAVRNAAGIFDISHMGEFFVSGEAAEAFLNSILTHDIRKLQPGDAQYSLMCNDHGGTVDDLYVYRLAATEFLLIVNASRIDADFSWIEKQQKQFPANDKLRIENASDKLSAVAIQGPKVASFIDTLFPNREGESPHEPTLAGSKLSQLSKNQFCKTHFDGREIFVARTGYTGEDGFEAVAPNDVIEAIWNQALKIGAPFGIQPAGLGARDTLRTEVCYPLYGHELDENTSPIEAGVGFFVSFDKGPFTGRDVLWKQKNEGTSRKCIAFVMEGKTPPPRPGYSIFDPLNPTVKIGTVVSGTQSPTLQRGIGLGYVPLAFAQPGSKILIEIRGNAFPATIAKKPLLRK